MTADAGGHSVRDDGGGRSCWGQRLTCGCGVYRAIAAAGALSQRAERSCAGKKGGRAVHSASVSNGAGSPRIMFAGHMDELGFQVIYIDEKGYLYFDNVGGFDMQIVPGRKVHIQTLIGTILLLAMALIL